MGLPCVFVRLAGCNLACSYCDTGYARDPAKGSKMSRSEIFSEVEKFGINLVEITGGEPLLAPQTPALVLDFLNRGYEVMVETNGSLDISRINHRARLIIDVKTPGSGMADSFLMSNLSHLRRQQQFKFVLCDENDFRWSVAFVERHLKAAGEIIFSPAVGGSLAPPRLAELILAARLRIRLQLQLHKILWPDQERGC